MTGDCVVRVVEAARQFPARDDGQCVTGRGELVTLETIKLRMFRIFIRFCHLVIGMCYIHMCTFGFFWYTLMMFVHGYKGKTLQLVTGLQLLFNFFFKYMTLYTFCYSDKPQPIFYY